MGTHRNCVQSLFRGAGKRRFKSARGHAPHCVNETRSIIEDPAARAPSPRRLPTIHHPPPSYPTWVRTIAASMVSCRRTSSSDLCLYMALASSGRFSHSTASRFASCSNVRVGEAALFAGGTEVDVGGGGFRVSRRTGTARTEHRRLMLKRMVFDAERHPK